jgi:hypothetical protein
MPQDDPTREEVLAWLAAHRGSTPADAVDALWPGASAEDRKRHQTRIRTWCWRSRNGLSSSASGDDDPDDEPEVPSEPPPPGLTREEWLEHQLQDLDRLIARAHRRDPRSVPALLAAASKLREELDAIRRTPPPAPAPGSAGGPLLSDALLAELTDHDLGVAVRVLAAARLDRPILGGEQLRTLSPERRAVVARTLMSSDPAEPSATGKG